MVLRHPTINLCDSLCDSGKLSQILQLLFIYQKSVTSYPNSANICRNNGKLKPITLL